MSSRASRVVDTVTQTQDDTVQSTRGTTLRIILMIYIIYRGDHTSEKFCNFRHHRIIFNYRRHTRQKAQKRNNNRNTYMYVDIYTCLIETVSYIKY